jgi:DtxR family transcriptional regulator, Mn-dependent transcriptional regulator
MSPIDLIRQSWSAFRRHAWGDDCPVGDPVPQSGRCAALDCDTVRLSALSLGDSGTVTCLEEPASWPSCKLAALGVLPGVRVTLLQNWPAFRFRVGYTELAVDGELARLIRLRRS